MCVLFVHVCVHVRLFIAVPCCACVANMLMLTTDHVSVCVSPAQLFICMCVCVSDESAQCGCWEGCWQWQRSRTLGNGVCTSRECITLTDASPLGHRGGGSAHSLSLPPRGRAWSTATHTQIETVIGYTIHTVTGGQREAGWTHTHTGAWQKHSFYTHIVCYRHSYREGYDSSHMKAHTFLSQLFSLEAWTLMS